MDQLDKKDVVQAVIIADNYNDCFKPFTDTKPMVQTRENPNWIYFVTFLIFRLSPFRDFFHW